MASDDEDTANNPPAVPEASPGQIAAHAASVAPSLPRSAVAPASVPSRRCLRWPNRKRGAKAKLY
jgi:hypothetical protein